LTDAAAFTRNLEAGFRSMMDATLPAG